MASSAAAGAVILPSPLARHLLKLSPSTVGIPRRVKVTQWGTPLASAKHVVFYFGGMPASAEEPALHSATSGHEDVYAARQIHLVCIDKPGMGQSSFAYRFQIRRDWPCIVDQVAQQLHMNGRYGVMGMSNGGPYVMASLTHPEVAHRVKAGCMIVGVSDAWASGYFSCRSPSTLFEGIYNSLPLAVAGPLNALALNLGSLYLFRLGGFESVFKKLPPEAKTPLKAVLRDGAATMGLGAAVDCQQGLSPLFARQSKDMEPESVHRQAELAYQNIRVPVSMWYGTKDSSVPMGSAEWLESQIPQATLHKVEDGHGLYFFHADEVLDDFVRIMDESDAAEAGSAPTNST